MRYALKYLGNHPSPGFDSLRHSMQDFSVGQLIEIPLEGLTIGRSAAAGLFVRSGAVARTHAAIMIGPDGPHFVDFLTSNGSEINGTAATSATIKPGDRLRFAHCYDFELVVVADDLGEHR